MDGSWLLLNTILHIVTPNNRRKEGMVMKSKTVEAEYENTRQNNDQMDGLLENLACLNCQRYRERGLQEGSFTRSNNVLGHSVFEMMPDGFALYKMEFNAKGEAVDYRFLTVNPAYSALTGLSSEAIVGKTVKELLPQIDPKWIEKYEQVVLTGIPQYFSKYSQLIGKNVGVFAFKVKDDEFACVFRDLTECAQKIMSTNDFEQQCQQSSKMEVIGTLAGGIAHDFNNILSAILGYADILKAEYRDQGDTREKLDKIVMAGRRAKDLVRHILSYSRKSGISPVPVHVGKVVEEALLLLRATIPTTIEMRREIEMNSGLIEADPVQIHQIVMNLCTNSFQAMEEEQGTISVSLQRHQIDSTQGTESGDLQPGSYLLLSVEDDGSGIRKKHLEHIFDPFFTTKGIGEGTGMGLAVVHGIVSSYGGKIDVESTVGHGTKVRVFLPYKSAESSGEVETEEEVEVMTSSRVLIVDDEREVANVTGIRLQRLGYRVTLTIQSTEALELFKKQPDAFDLVITDQTMPEMTGEKLAAEMMAIRSDIPIILCTGYSSRVDQESAKRSGIKAFLYKPVTRETMAATVRQVLDESPGLPENEKIEC